MGKHLRIVAPGEALRTGESAEKRRRDSAREGGGGEEKRGEKRLRFWEQGEERMEGVVEKKKELMET